MDSTRRLRPAEFLEPERLQVEMRERGGMKGLVLCREVQAGERVTTAQVQVLVKVLGQEGSRRLLRNSRRQQGSPWLVVCICTVLAQDPRIDMRVPASQGFLEKGSQ